MYKIFVIKSYEYWKKLIIRPTNRVIKFSQTSNSMQIPHATFRLSSLNKLSLQYCLCNF